MDLDGKSDFMKANQLCAAVGFSEQQIEDLTNRTIDYFVNGPRDILRSSHRQSPVECTFSPTGTTKGFKADYGLRLMQQGVSPDSVSGKEIHIQRSDHVGTFRV